jgi:ABC-type multidrug transport system fused ATPase/permease subunit
LDVPALLYAHRLTTVEKANQILILEQGRVSEYGQREKLAKDEHSRFAQLLQTGLTDLLI